MKRARSGEKGIAMVTAIGLALIVSIMAAVVLNMTFRRFELSALRTQHAVAMMGSEAGFQYAFARMDRDPAFRTLVQAKAATTPYYYVVRCHADDPSTTSDDLPDLFKTADVLDGRLHMGNKHVAVAIRYYTANNAGDPNTYYATRPYKVRAVSVVGAGG